MRGRLRICGQKALPRTDDTGEVESGRTQTEESYSQLDPYSCAAKRQQKLSITATRAYLNCLFLVIIRVCDRHRNPLESHSDRAVDVQREPNASMK